MNEFFTANVCLMGGGTGLEERKEKYQEKESVYKGRRLGTLKANSSG